MAVSERIKPDDLFSMSENVFAAMPGLDSDIPEERALKNVLYRVHEILHERGRRRAEAAE